MDGPGFHVEPDVLDAAARGMVETVADQDAAELATLAGPPERYGHAGVHAAVADFCAAWSVGADALCDRARRGGTDLAEAAAAYRAAEADLARVLAGEPEQAPAGDPGRGAVEPDPPLVR